MSAQEAVALDLKTTPTRELLRLHGEAASSLKKVLVSAPNSADRFRLLVESIIEEIVSRTGE